MRRPASRPQPPTGTLRSRPRSSAPAGQRRRHRNRSSVPAAPPPSCARPRLRVTKRRRGWTAPGGSRAGRPARLRSQGPGRPRRRRDRTHSSIRVATAAPAYPAAASMVPRSSDAEARAQGSSRRVIACSRQVRSDSRMPRARRRRVRCDRSHPHHKSDLIPNLAWRTCLDAEAAVTRAATAKNYSCW
jgi:hypothetical protein